MRSDNVDLQDAADAKVLRQSNTIALLCAVGGLLLAFPPLVANGITWGNFGLLSLALGAFMPQAFYWLKFLRDRFRLLSLPARLFFTFVIMAVLAGLILPVVILVSTISQQ